MVQEWREVLDRRNGVEIGLGDETEPGTFYPHLKLKRWDGEAYFSIRLVDIWPGRAKVVVENGKTKWKKAAVETLFYPLPATPTLREGGFEFEIVLKERAPTNQIVFKLQTKNLRFFYQPPLSPEEEARGCIRPERVVGSYAVYHEEAVGDFTALGGKNYGTGKAFHIYRPRVKDAQGDEIWADLVIDELGGHLTIIVDASWLASAAYPVSIDPTFGYDTIGGSSGQVGWTAIFASGMGTPASSGTVTTLHIYGFNGAGGDTDVSVGLYTDDGESPSGPLTKVGTEKETAIAENATPRWMDFPTNALPITGGNKYWPSANSSPDLTVYYDAPAGTNRYWDTHTYGVAWPTTYSQDASSAAKYSMYCTYTVAVTYEDLAGSSAGVAGVAGALGRIRGLSGAAGGGAGVSAVCVRRRGLSGAVAGLSTPVAMMAPLRSLVGTSDGVASVVAAMVATRSLVGGSDGVAGVAAALHRVRELSGAPAGIASVIASLVRRRGLSTASAGVASVGAALQKLRELVGSSAGETTVTAKLNARLSLSGASSGVATVVATLLRVRELAGTSDGVATVMGTLISIGEVLLSGASAGVAVVTASMVRTRNLVGSSSGVAVVAAAMVRLRALIGSSAGVATVSAKLNALIVLSGTIAGQATVAGNLLTELLGVVALHARERTFAMHAKARSFAMHARKRIFDLTARRQ